MDESPHIGYEFSGFHVDPLRRMLFGADGMPIRLKPKVFDTLLYLVEHPRELLDKRTLLKAVWPHVIVEENNLSQAISTLRRVLGEHPGDHRFILTEPGRGYRFVATISRPTQEYESLGTIPGQGYRKNDRVDDIDHGSSPEATASGQVARRRVDKTAWWLGAAIALLVALVLAGTVFLMPGQRNLRSIAVLPFENLSADEAHEIFVRAIHDDIVTRLAKISALKVISRESALQYRVGTRNLREIANELDVATVLEGTVLRADDTVRMNVKLIDARTGELLWSESYDRDHTVQNVIAIQIDIARNIANALEAKLTPTESRRLNQQPTQNTKAYEFYLSGSDYARCSGLLRDLPSAVQQYERAIEEDPEFALAPAHLSIENIHMYWTEVARAQS